MPVVSVEVGDVRKRLHGIAGCFIADPTPEDIAKKIGRALAHPVRITGRESVTGLALERVAARLHEIYGLVARNTVRADGGAL